MDPMRKILQQSECHLALFCLFLFLFFFPVLRGDNVHNQAGMFAYLFTAWGGCILLLLVIARRLDPSPETEGDQAGSPEA